MKMAITLETIHADIRQVKTELNRLLTMLDDESELTDTTREALQKAREEMTKGKFVGHEVIMSKYG